MTYKLSGFGPTQIHSVVGIIKSYTTRVGGGPFVTELTDETGERIQTVGHEYGATTGRKRRCGWLDMVMIRQSVRLSGITGFSLTKLDVLSGIEKLKIWAYPPVKNHKGRIIGYTVPVFDINKSSSTFRIGDKFEFGSGNQWNLWQ